MESKVILYHSNKKEKCQKFINNESPLIISENTKDDIWLGKGMYFWNNKGNAKWWNRQQSFRHNNSEYSIIVINALFKDNLLDLTDFDVYMNLENLWKKFCLLLKYKYDMPLGNKLDILFDALNFGEKYDLIKVYGKYNYTPNKGFFSYDFKSMKAEPTIGVKCIYNIRKETCIIEKDWFKEVQ